MTFTPIFTYQAVTSVNRRWWTPVGKERATHKNVELGVCTACGALVVTDSEFPNVPETATIHIAWHARKA